MSTQRHPNIQRFINEFDSVLAQINQTKILFHEFFKIEESPVLQYVTIKTRKRRKSINFNIQITPSEIIFNIDKTVELPVFPLNNLDDHRNELSAFINDLLTSRVKVTYQGAKTTIQFIDSDQSNLNKLEFREEAFFLFGSPLKIKEFFYEPLFEQ